MISQKFEDCQHLRYIALQVIRTKKDRAISDPVFGSFLSEKSYYFLPPSDRTTELIIQAEDFL